MLRFALLASAGIGIALSEGAWKNITVYDVLQEDCRFDVANKNVGDIPGDAFFMLKDKFLSYACPKYCKHGLSQLLCLTDPNLFDCVNAESTGNLVVRKINIEVWTDFGAYSMCNAKGKDKCGYFCGGTLDMSGRVGSEPVEPGHIMGVHPFRPFEHRDIDYWAYNVAAKMRGGMWYSLEKKGEGKYWRNPKFVKTINGNCQSKWLQRVVEQQGQDCFHSCRDAKGGLDESSECYMKCFFDTALGGGSSNSTKSSGGLGRDVLTEAWAQGFSSDDMSKGGCPPCPPTGPCPTPTTGTAVLV